MSGVARGNALLDERERDLRNELALQTQAAKYFKGEATKLRRQSGESEKTIREQEEIEARLYPTT